MNLENYVSKISDFLGNNTDKVLEFENRILANIKHNYLKPSRCTAQPNALRPRIEIFAEAVVFALAWLERNNNNNNK